MSIVYSAEELPGILDKGLHSSYRLKDPQGRPLPVGLIEGNWHQFFNQAAGVLIAWGIVIVIGF